MMKKLMLMALLLPSGAGAVEVKLRPQGEMLTQAVQAALAQLSSKDLPVTLNTSSGPTLTLGGVGVSAAPFNPDVAARVVVVNGERRIEFNPQGPLPLSGAVRAELGRELNLGVWTPAGAAARFSGADLNGDGAINLTDLALLMENMGKEGAVTGDLNADRKVDDGDMKLFVKQYLLP